MTALVQLPVQCGGSSSSSSSSKGSGAGSSKRRRKRSRPELRWRPTVAATGGQPKPTPKPTAAKPPAELPAEPPVETPAAAVVEEREAVAEVPAAEEAADEGEAAKETARAEEAVADAKVAEDAQVTKASEPREAGEQQVADRGCLGALQCPSGHKMQRFATALPSICSSCNKELTEGTEMWGCRACDYDVCEACTKARAAAADAVPEFECGAGAEDQADYPELALPGDIECWVCCIPVEMAKGLGLEGVPADGASWQGPDMVWWAPGTDCWTWWWPLSTGGWWDSSDSSQSEEAESTAVTEDLATQDLPAFDAFGARFPQLVGDETLLGPDGELYEVFYPPDGPPEHLEPKADRPPTREQPDRAGEAKRCEGGEADSLAGAQPAQAARRRTSAEDVIADIVTFMSCAAVARYPARVSLFELVQAATVDALGDHFGRFALVGSTALLIDTPDSDLDAVVFTRSIVDRAGLEMLPPGPAQALRWIATALIRHDCSLQLQLVDSARVPVLTVLTADGALSLDLTVDEPLGLSHVRWFQSQRSQPIADSTDSAPPCQWCQLPVPSPDGWEHGLEAAVLRCVKWWLRRRRIPVTREGGYPTVVWTLMVLHVLRCSLYVNDSADSGNQVRTLLAAIAAFFDRLVEGTLRGTLLFGGGGGAEFRPQPASSSESQGGLFLGPSLAELSVLDPTTTGEESASWGVMPAELAPRMSAATELLHTYELRRAQRLSAASLVVGGGGGAAALCGLFREIGDSLNICPAALPSKTSGMFVLSEGRLVFGTCRKVHPKPGWSAPFLHRRDESSRIALRCCHVDAATGAVAASSEEEALRWFRPCDFVCMAPLRRRDPGAAAPAGVAALAAGAKAVEASCLELEAEGLERWREMRVLLGEEPISCPGSAQGGRGQGGKGSSSRRRACRRQRARSERA